MSDNIAADDLRQEVEAIERLESEKAGIAEDLKERYACVKSKGYDTKTVRKIIAIRKKEREVVSQEQAMLSTYMVALGMQYALL